MTTILNTFTQIIEGFISHLLAKYPGEACVRYTLLALAIALLVAIVDKSTQRWPPRRLLRRSVYLLCAIGGGIYDLYLIHTVTTIRWYMFAMPFMACIPCVLVYHFAPDAFAIEKWQIRRKRRLIEKAETKGRASTLVRYATDKEDSIRAASFAALSRLDNPIVAPRLVTLLTTYIGPHLFAKNSVRRSAAECLTPNSYKQEVNRLMRALFKQASPEAAFVLARIGDHEILSKIHNHKSYNSVSAKLQHGLLGEFIDPFVAEVLVRLRDSHGTKAVCALLLSVESRLRKGAGTATQHSLNDTPSGFYGVVHEATLRREIEFAHRVSQCLGSAIDLLDDSECMQLALARDIIATYQGYISNYDMPPYYDTIRLHQIRAIARSELSRRGKESPIADTRMIAVP